MSTFRKFFSHSRTEISHAFLKAKPVFSGSGIKILHALTDPKRYGSTGFQASHKASSDSAPQALIQSLSKDEAHLSKLLVVIPRKSGNACERNRFRRRVKSLFYEEKWHAQPGFWIIIAYPRALALNFDALKALLQKTFVSTIKETIE